MKTFWKSIKITLAFCALLGVGYVLILWGVGSIAGPNGGRAAVVTENGRIVGAANVGQSFTKATYFWGRPSAVEYNGSGSGGSNKATTNPEYRDEVKARIDTFLTFHPYLLRQDVPSEMVTASGSGLDPDISPAGAYVQARRVAEARGLSEQTVRELIRQTIQKPWLGLFGTEKVNVLQLNVALDRLKPAAASETGTL